MLEYCWLFALLLRSARFFTGVEGEQTLLPPISPPSSQIFMDILIILILLIHEHGTYFHVFMSSLVSFLKIFYLFIFRERENCGERKGEKYHCVVASHVAPNQDPA